MVERSLVLFKTDVVQRGIVGEIMHRFERSGLKIVGLKLVNVEKHMAENHYKTTDENLAAMGNKTVEDAAKTGADLMAKFGSTDPVEIGRVIWKWNTEYLSAGPVIAMVLEGPSAISNIRMMVGSTLPSMATPGTIRGDFGLESATEANERNRSIYNMMHASGNKEEAEFEINLWFNPDELLTYKRAHEGIYSY